MPLVNEFTRKTYGVLSTTSSLFVTRSEYEIVSNVFVVPLKAVTAVNVGGEAEIGDMEVNKDTMLDVSNTLE